MTSSSDVRCGVYQISLSPTHFYIGRSLDIPRRVRRHMLLLTRGAHENLYMQRVYNLHGQFNYDVVFPCTADNVQSVEQMYLSTWMKTDGCMNLNPSSQGGPGMTGKRHSEETKARIREARSRQVFSEETRQKFSEASKGNKRQRGHAHSPGTRLKMSEAKKGKPLSESHLQAVQVANASKKGKPLSDTHRATLSEAQKKRWAQSRMNTPTEGTE